MPTSKDLTDLESQVKKSLISAESFKRGSSMDPSNCCQSILSIHKTIGTLAGHTKKLVIRVNDLEKNVNNQSKKITSLKNISKSQSERISGANIGAKLPGGSVDNVNENIKAITDSLTSIAEILAGGKKLKSDTAAFDRRKAEQDKRALAESKLEKSFNGLKKVAEKIIAPVKSILDRIIDFFVTVFLGRVVYKLLEWFGDPKNADKVRSIIRFLGDHWPKLLALYLTFGTSFGRFALGLAKGVAAGAVKLAFAIAKLLAAKKVKGAMGAARFLGGGKGKLLANVIGTVATVGTAYAGTQMLKGDGGGEQKTQAYRGGGYVTPRFPAFGGGGFNFDFGSAMSNVMGGMKGMFGFGQPQETIGGYVSGEEGVDKVPAMLSDGEFVMSRGAVQKYGVDTLESMNAAGGGTNKPKMVSGKAFAAGGGLIGYAGNIIKHHEALSSLTRGANDYVFEKDSRLKKLGNKAQIHPYLDSVNVPTIGWGATYYDSLLSGGKPVKMTDPPITKKAADNLLDKHLNELIPHAKRKLPLWNKMSPQQHGAIISFLYNAGANAINPSGPYPKLSKALIDGNMIMAAAQIKRSGPSQSRIIEEQNLLKTGPLDLKKAKPSSSSGVSVTNPKPQPNLFQQAGSSIMNLITGGSRSTAAAAHSGTQKLGTGGYAPKPSALAPAQLASATKPRNNITPLPRKRSTVSSLRGMNMGAGGGYSGSAGSGGSSIPSFSATAPGSDRSNKLRTLGIM